ncbi:hypothetical protein SEPCBS119000_000140 [Sporothrix epigloea]|uniref:C6 zinc finger domain containing protein n=1 Tax=Sporothrix epigloea TaxID=1892477 RepID=A0ABP0D3F7_9PEZI
MPEQGSVSPRLSPSGARTNAKWGAACASCASAKAKCIRSNEKPGSKCDRKTDQLEERLNGLVDLLRATGELPTGVNVTVPGVGNDSMGPRPESTSTTSPFNPPSVSSATHNGSGQSTRTSAVRSPSETREARGIRDLRWDMTAPPPPPLIPSTYNAFAPPACICRPEAGETVTDAVESDDVLLSKFRTHMHPQLPIVVLPDNITAAQLAAAQPFLFLAVKTVASVENYRSMQGLMYQVINHVAEYMLLRAERSLDMLQGLMTILSWYHHHCMMHAQLSNLLHLATSLVSDLGLSRPARLAERTDLMVLQPNPPSPRTHMERRLLLGLWYIRSSMALCFQKTEPMRFTPYMRQCLQELEDAGDAETNATLVALVRMQMLAEKIGNFNCREECAEEVPYFPRAPRAAYKIAFQSELDQLVASLSTPLKKHVLIESHIASITLRLSEPPLLDLALLRKLSVSLTSSGSPCTVTALDKLFCARAAIKGFFDQFLSLSTDGFQWLPIPMYINLIYGITMLSRWVRLIGPTRISQPNPHGSSNTDKCTTSTSNSTDNVAPSSLATASTGISCATAATSSAPQCAVPAVSSLDLKDPSHRLVPGQGVGATFYAGAGAISSPFMLIPGMDARELQRDPSLLTAVLRLREHMRQQPDLQLDILAILTAIWDKFEKSNRELRAAGAAKFGDSVGRGLNVWDVTARKIAIMRFKVGRYLDGAMAPVDPSSNDDGSHAPERQQPQAHASQPSQSQAEKQPLHQQPQQLPPQLPQQQPALFQPTMPYARQWTLDQQQGVPEYIGANTASVQQQQQQQSLPLHTTQMPTFGLGSADSPTRIADAPGAGMANVFSQMNGLPADLSSYVMGGQGVAVADLSLGLGNLEGWDSDPLWGADLFGTGNDPGMWAENMDWVATLR